MTPNSPALKIQVKQVLHHQTYSGDFLHSEEEYLQILEDASKFIPHKIDEGHLETGFYNKTYALDNSFENKHSDHTLPRDKTTFGKEIKRSDLKIIYDDENEYFTTRYAQKVINRIDALHNSLLKELGNARDNVTRNEVRERLKLFSKVSGSIRSTVLFKRKILLNLLNSQSDFLKQVMRDKEITLQAILKLKLQVKKQTTDNMNLNQTWMSVLSKELDLKLGDVKFNINTLGHRDMHIMIREAIMKSIMKQPKMIDVITNTPKNKLSEKELVLLKKIKAGKGAWTPELISKAMEIVHPNNIKKFNLKVAPREIKQYHPNFFKPK